MSLSLWSSGCWGLFWLVQQRWAGCPPGLVLVLLGGPILWTPVSNVPSMPCFLGWCWLRTAKLLREDSLVASPSGGRTSLLCLGAEPWSRVGERRCSSPQWAERSCLWGHLSVPSHHRWLLPWQSTGVAAVGPSPGAVSDTGPFVALVWDCLVLHLAEAEADADGRYPWQWWGSEAVLPMVSARRGKKRPSLSGWLLCLQGRRPGRCHAQGLVASPSPPPGQMVQENSSSGRQCPASGMAGGEVGEELPIPARLGVSVMGLAGDQVPGRTAWRSRHGVTSHAGFGVLAVRGASPQSFWEGRPLKWHQVLDAPAEIPGDRQRAETRGLG